MRVAALIVLALALTPGAAAGPARDAVATAYTLVCEPPPATMTCRIAGNVANGTADLVDGLPAYLLDKGPDDAVTLLEFTCYDASTLPACEAIAGDPGAEDVRPCREPPAFSDDPARFLLSATVHRADEVLLGATESPLLAKTPLEGAQICRDHWQTLHGAALLV